VRRVIAHVDMDAFFVACELRRRPELRGKPVLVATGTDPTARGVVMAASYEARKFGVHSALPLAIAHRRCPQAVLIPRDISLYREVSRQVMDVLRSFSDRVEVAGLDEAYLDLSASPAPRARARELKGLVKERTGLVCSVGLAPNKLLAKIASDLDKPDGLCALEPERMHEAVGDRPASILPGVGPKTAQRLESLGVRTVAELARMPAERLEATFGPRHGRGLHDLAHGRDERPVVTKRRPKSESRETTFSTNVDDRELLRTTLARLVDSVCAGLKKGGYEGRTVTLKIRLAPFRTYTRSKSLSETTNDPSTVKAVAVELLDRFEPDAPVRLVGVGVANLSSVEREPPSEEPSSPSATGDRLTLDV
jgi:DNA polymerase-4